MAGVPGITIREVDLTAYIPSSSEAIVGLIGPATKGEVNVINDITDEGTYTNALGIPSDGFHGMRAAIRYLKQGSSLKYVRIAGSLLATAAVNINNAADTQLILTFLGISPGSWANNNVAIGITHNGVDSYNVFVYVAGILVESYQNVTNGTVATAINGISAYVTVTVDPLAAAIFPKETLNTSTGEIEPVFLLNGNDGAFASTISPASLTGGVSARTFWTEDFPFVAASLSQAFTLSAPCEPGSLSVDANTGGVLTDNGDGTLTGAGTSGTVNYETGEVTLTLLIAPTANIDVSYRYGTIEESAVTAPSQLVYTGNISRPGLISNSFRVLIPREDQLDIGTGLTVEPYAPTLQGGDVERETLTITAKKSTGETMTVTDDGNGNLIGDVPTPTVAVERIDFSGAGTTPAPAFVLGEVITQAVSLASGIVVGVISADVYIINRTTVATFNAVNNVTGSLGGGGTTPGIPLGVPTAVNTINYATGALNLFFEEPVGPSEVITANYQQHAEDNGSGVVSGANLTAGTINYVTGAYSFTFALTTAGNYVPNFPDGLAFQFQYGHADVLGTGDGIEDTFSGTLSMFPVKPGSVLLLAGAISVADNGAGILTGVGGAGTINYWTGAFTFTFTAPPAVGVEVNVLSDAILLHVEFKKAGPDGNREAVLTNGFHTIWDDSPTVPGTYRFRTRWYNGVMAADIEVFDQLRDANHAFEVINGLAGNTGSRFVRFLSTGFPGIANSATQQIGLAGAFTTADVIGTQVGPVRTGLQLFNDPETVPVNFLSAPGMYNREVTTAGIALASANGRRVVWIGSMPDFSDWRDARDYVNGSYNAAIPNGPARPTPDVMKPLLAAVNSSYCVWYFSWCQYFDAYADTDVFEPPEGFVLSRIAATDRDNNSWDAVAGLRRALLTDVTDVRYSPTAAERAQMYGLVGNVVQVINPIVKFIGQGIAIYGQRTSQRSASATDRLNVRWALNILENTMEFVSRIFPFEQADGVLFRQIKNTIEGVLAPIQAGRGLSGFRVVCNETTNPPEQLQQNRVKCKVFVQWTPTAEAIEYEVVLTPLGVNLNAV